MAKVTAKVVGRRGADGSPVRLQVGAVHTSLSLPDGTSLEGEEATLPCEVVDNSVGGGRFCVIRLYGHARDIQVPASQVREEE